MAYHMEVLEKQSAIGVDVSTWWTKYFVPTATDKGIEDVDFSLMQPAQK